MIAGAIFLVNRGQSPEADTLSRYYVPYAEFLRGGAKPDFISYPVWGYPALMALIGEKLLLPLQYVLTLVMFFIMDKRLFATTPVANWNGWLILLLSIPWFAYFSVPWPGAVAAFLLWMSITFLLPTSNSKHEWANVTLAGVCAGLALNFRTESLLWIPVMALVLAVKRPKKSGAREVAVAAGRSLLFILVSLLTLLPWAYFNTGSGDGFRWSASNTGAVAVISLGQLPGNPWGLHHEDREAQRVLAELGYGGTDPFGPRGDPILRRHFLKLVTEHPASFAAKTVWNAKNVLLGGQYVGTWDQWTGGHNAESVDVLKEKVKAAIGLNPNESQIADYKRRGQWDRPPTSVLGVGVLAGVGGALTLISVVAVLGAVIGVAVLSLRKRWDPRLALVGGTVAAVVLSAALVQYQPRHINPAWPALVILSSFTTLELRRFLPRRRQGVAADS